MRIQILLLPPSVNGDADLVPFALIVDQLQGDAPDEAAAAAWRKFREDVGARAVLVTPNTVDIIDRDAGDVAELVERLPRTTAHVDVPPGLDVDEVSAEARRQVRNLGDSWT